MRSARPLPWIGKISKFHALHEARGIGVGVLLGLVAWAAIIAVGVAALWWF